MAGTGMHAPLGILSALAEEQGDLVSQLTDARVQRRAGRDFHCGLLHGQPVVLGLSRIGKVAAATTSAAMIEGFGISRMVFTGVAGGVGAGVEIGDVVLGSSYAQHDMDASPLFPRYEIPLYGQTLFAADGDLLQALQQACGALSSLALQRAPQIHQGLIVSGDQFVSGLSQSQGLVSAMQADGHQPLAVEMECAAVAQVCADYGVPFAAVRTISDRADDTAHVDFPHFIRTVASVYAQAIIDRLVRQL